MSSTDVEVIDGESMGVALYDPAMFPELVDQNPDDVQAAMAARFSRAESIEDLFSILEGSSSKTMVGRKVQINGVKWTGYESDRGVIPMAICDAMDLKTGEVVEFATTSGFLTMFIRRAELIGHLGFQVKIVEKKTRSGNTALNFEPV
jgi:hypothetical protein